MKLNMKGAVGILAAGTAAGLIMLGGPSSQKAEDGKERIILQEEIVSLRQENVKVFATNRADTRVAHVYAKPVHYRDKRTGELREYDLSVKISKADDPERFVDIGNGRVTWREGSESDYRFEDGSGHYVAYRFLTDARGIEVQNEYGKGGVKQSYILESDGAGSELAWQIETNAVFSEHNGELIFTDVLAVYDLFRTAAPVAWDRHDKPVEVRVSVAGDTLIYRVDTEGAAFPVTVDPSTYLSTAGSNYYGYLNNNTTGGSWEDIRNLTTSASNATGVILSGFSYDNGATRYDLYRSFAIYSCADSNIYVSAAALKSYISQLPDSSGAKLDVLLGTQTGTRSDAWWNDFYGWAASGAYGGVIQPIPSIDLSGYSVSDTLDESFSSAGIDSLNAAFRRGGSFRLAFLTHEDVLNYGISWQATHYEYITLSYPFIEITYTVASPENFSTEALSETSIRCTWTDNIYGESGFRIIDAYTGAYYDSVGPGIETIDLTGLIPNTIYALKAQVIGGTADGQVSPADSSCTDASAPAAAPDTSDVTYTTMTVYPDTSGTGNPEDTDYAIVFITTDYDTLYVDASADPDTLREALGVEDEWGWRTYDEWGGAGGVMVTGLDPARTYAVGVMARRRDFPE